MNDRGRWRSTRLNCIRLTFWPIALGLPLLILAHSAKAAEIFEEIIEQRHFLEPDGTLSIHNTDGAIRVYAGDGSEVRIQAIKRAYTPDRLKSIMVDVKATQKSVAVETIVPPNKSRLSLKDGSGTVDYIITVPSTVRITKLDLVNGEVLVEGLRGGSTTAHVTNGWLVAHNCFGDLDMTLENGRLEVTYDWWEDTEFSVKLLSPDGDIRTIIPADASLSIIAQAEPGRIINKLVANKEAQGSPVHALNFKAGSAAKTVFEMKSTSGDIRIEKAY